MSKGGRGEKNVNSFNLVKHICHFTTIIFGCISQVSLCPQNVFVLIEADLKNSKCVTCIFISFNIHIFDYPDSRLPRLFPQVPLSPDKY